MRSRAGAVIRSVSAGLGEPVVAWIVGLVAVFLDGVVVTAFINAEPTLLEPEMPLVGQPSPRVPPSFPLLPFAVIGAALVAVYILVAFSRQHWTLKAFYLVLVVVWLVFSFSLTYYSEGNDEEGHPGSYPEFGHSLSKNEALYFTVGTLTTSGTGALSAKSHYARSAVIVQMGLDVLVLVIGIAGIVGGRDRPAVRIPDH